MSRAILLVDVQNDFCEEGALAVPGGNQVAQNLAKFLTPSANPTHSYDYILASRDWHKSPGEHFQEWPVHCVADTVGAGLHPALAQVPFDAIFDKGEYKPAFSAFDGTTFRHQGWLFLAEWLDTYSVRDLDICGIATEYCVLSTVRDACDIGYNVRVLTNLLAGVDPKACQAALDEMSQRGAEVESR